MILAIIQARMSSTRLPRKSLMLLHGKPILQWVFEAANQSKLIDRVVVATSNQESDFQIIKFAEKYVDVFPGSLYDVLDRFYQTSLKYSPDHIVRLTADCPLLSGEIIDNVVSCHLKEKNDYTWNRDSCPSGFDVEIFTFNALKKAYSETKNLYDREHVTPYIRNNPQIFKIGNCNSGIKIYGKWSIDTKEDYSKVFDIFFVFKEVSF